MIAWYLLYLFYIPFQNYFKLKNAKWRIDQTAFVLRYFLLITLFKFLPFPLKRKCLEWNIFYFTPFILWFSAFVISWRIVAFPGALRHSWLGGFSLSSLTSHELYVSALHHKTFSPLNWTYKKYGTKWNFPWNFRTFFFLSKYGCDEKHAILS